MIRRTMALSVFVVGLFVLVAAGCATRATATASAQSADTVFVLVRHAEKAKDDPKDPTLSETGIARAKRLADSLANARVIAAYATQYRRTRLTAMPTAMSHHLELQTYDASLPAAEFAKRLRESHRSGTVLVVGHSNTIPDLASALCACEVASMGEGEFDRRMFVRIAADGSARLDVQRD